MNKLTNNEFENRVLKTGTGITAISEYVGGRIKAKFRCFCGKEFLSYAGDVMYGYKKSCGCKSSGSGWPTWNGCGDISGYIFSGIRSSAKKRDLEFSINVQYVWELFLKQNKRCIYTGRELVFMKKFIKGAYDQTASLDRIDSSKGYVEGNVQWIHKDIQEIKWDRSEIDFIELCQEVISYYKNGGIKNGTK